VTPREYAIAVVSERKALNTLQRLLKGFGSTVTLARVEAAWNEWRGRAEVLEGVQEEERE